ncbi:MAG: hypothetical protein V4819_01270 [Verrucomicrobiota bacterium]
MMINQVGFAGFGFFKKQPLPGIVIGEGEMLLSVKSSVTTPIHRNTWKDRDIFAVFDSVPQPSFASPVSPKQATRRKNPRCAYFQTVSKILRFLDARRPVDGICRFCGGNRGDPARVVIFATCGKIQHDGAGNGGQRRAERRRDGMAGEERAPLRLSGSQG